MQDPKERTASGIQLWTVRELLKADAPSCLSALAQMGFTTVETAGLTQLGELKMMLNDLDIDCNASHFNTHDLGLDPHRSLFNQVLKGQTLAKHNEAMLQQAAELELSYLGCAYIWPEHRQALDDYHALIDFMFEFSLLAENYGLQLFFHNHAYEFRSIGGHQPFELMAQACQTSKITLEIDLMWAAIASQNIPELFDRWRAVIKMVHLKDGMQASAPNFDDSTYPSRKHRALGHGEMPVLDWLKILQARADIDIYWEQDFCWHGLDECQQSAEFLRQHGFLP